MFEFDGKNYNYFPDFRYKDKIIDNLRFAFNVDNKQGGFHFGGLPEHAKIVNKGSIKIDESLPTWGFHISNIKYGGVEKVIENYLLSYDKTKYKFSIITQKPSSAENKKISN